MWFGLSAWGSMNIVFAYVQLGWGPPEFGIASACINAVVLVYQLKLQHRLINCVGPKRCYAGALLGQSAAFATFSACAHIPPKSVASSTVFVAAYLTLTFCAHTASACTSMIIMLHYATPKSRGLLAGLLHTTRMVAMSTAPLAYLHVFQLGYVDRAWLFASGSVLMGCIWWVLGPARGCSESKRVT